MQNFVRFHAIESPSSHPNYTSGGIKAVEPSLPWKIKIVMACLRIILCDESQTVGNSPLRSSSPMLNPTNQPTKKRAQLSSFSVVSGLFVSIFLWIFLNVYLAFLFRRLFE